ncbi:MAG TPA: 2-hydroxyacyl-CoA dehydratase family protein [Gemmataceae bacterium]|nr:2-hydroxyacyl-CoA dehydratase family protein [Gemmataceae bacterium]
MTASPAPPAEPVAFPYEQLLAYYRGELADRRLAAEIEQHLSTDPRWEAHWESIRYLDLERAAAMQDAEDLQRYLAGLSVAIDPFCKAVALSDGMILVPVVERRSDTREGTWEQWADHLDLCVYCRRMQRSVLAYRTQQQLGLTGPLLREWLLESVYAPLLASATNTIIRAVAVSVLYPTNEGFRAVQVGDRREDLASPTGSRGGKGAEWYWNASEEATGVLRTRGTQEGEPESSAVPALPRKIEFSRELAGNRGSLEVTFKIAESGNLVCEVALSLPQGAAPSPEVTLEVALNDQVSSHTGTESPLRVRVEGGKPDPEGLGGLGTRITVRQGQEIWDESAFKFGR